jgi:molecular chaperone GrpE
MDMSEPKPESAPAPPSGDPGAVEPQAGGDPASQLEALRREKDEASARLQRMAADFDNFMKRSRQEVEDERRRAGAEILRSLLAVLDDLDRAVAAATAAGESGKLLDGIRLVQEKFLATLKRHDVEPMESAGRPFDPACHEAVAVEATDRVDEDVVLEEYVRGYVRGGRVLRPARVKISKRPEPAAAGDGVDRS